MTTAEKIRNAVAHRFQQLLVMDGMSAEDASAIVAQYGEAATEYIASLEPLQRDVPEVLFARSVKQALEELPAWIAANA